MKTPIYDFLTQYNNEQFCRFHMPGHKGNGTLCEAFDITEIKGADSLFSADGIIAESEKNATKLFGTQKTLYSTQGSTLCINTMLALACQGQENPLVIAVRNAHKAFVNSCVLIGAQVKWIFPKYSQNSITSGEYSVLDIKKAILECDRKPCCVYITSPDYLGVMADIKSIAEICHENDIALLVDNAHGGYLKFLENDIHPITLGADMCCDSAHKTLPVLTSGGYLHISKKANKTFCDNAKTTMSLFASTSPSYLTLASLDLCNKYLNDEISSKLVVIIERIDKLKIKLSEYGFFCVGDEKLKLSLYTINNGLYGYDVAQMLRNNKIECEYADQTHIVFMFSSETTTQEIDILEKALLHIRQPRIKLMPTEFCYTPPKISCDMRSAVFSTSEEIDTEKSEGRICSKVVIACPPGIPVVVPGEIINYEAIKILKKYSIMQVNVVK